MQTLSVSFFNYGLETKRIECLQKHEYANELVKFLENLMIEQNDQKGCIVFDIDDTLVSQESYPLQDIVRFLHFCKKQGFIIALVTARHSSMNIITKVELQGINIIQGRDYKAEDLFFCPDSYRVSYVKISQWKQSARKFLKNKYKTVFLTVGDQWTDLITIKDEKDRRHLDQAYSTFTHPYLVFKLYDGIANYGFKLKDSPVVEPKYVLLKVGRNSSKLQSKIIFNE